MIRSYGSRYFCDFPNANMVRQTLGDDDIAHVKSIVTEYDYILTKKHGTLDYDRRFQKAFYIRV